ncbi:hypothetical protein FACS18945_4290 [Bacteroidia bacterium]|nr:hypothetical protein FACS18945_4290 [Bacteroidia bacterium]
MKINKYKHIGIILAVSTLFVIYVSNALLYNFGIHINLSINGLHYCVNFILMLLTVTLYLLFRLHHKKLIFFVISVLILQNLLCSIIVDLYQKSEYYDLLNDFSFLMGFPIAIIGTFIWGLIFDYLRNKKTKNE